MAGRKKTQSREEQRQSRLHERKIQHCGAELEIVEYRTYKDIDVKVLPDGPILKHRNYGDFDYQRIAVPGFKSRGGSEYAMNDIPTPEPKDLLKRVHEAYPDKTSLEIKQILKRVRKRLRNGWYVDDAIYVPPIQSYAHTPETTSNMVKCVDHLGNVYPSRNARARHYKLHPDVISERIDRGWSLEKALTTPAGEFHVQHKTFTDIDGVTYPTYKEAAKAWDIPIKTFEYRVRHGWSIEQICLTPVSKLNRVSKHV